MNLVHIHLKVKKKSDCTSEEEFNSAGPSSVMPNRKAQSDRGAGGVKRIDDGEGSHPIISVDLRWCNS